MAEALLREGERATLFRFWMTEDAYQDISPVQSLISAYRVRYSLTTPSLAYTLIFSTYRRYLPPRPLGSDRPSVAR